MIIAVDAVGGDHIPENPVKGSIQAVREKEDLTVVLVGREGMLKDELQNHEYDKNRISIQDAPEIIEMDAPPAQAIKTKKNSSIAVGLGMHKAGNCDAFISAGNTGALLAASTLLLGKLEGVVRPTIGATFPTIHGFRLLLDAGANLEVRPDVFVQFARMGSIYTEEVMGIENPKIGLLNVGEEEEKGTDELREVYTLLKELPNFVGNVEGRDVLPAKADIFLTNGLVGNILLKFGESIPDALEQLIGATIKKANLQPEQAKLVIEIFKSATANFNYESVGGIPFLGVNGVSMVGHGGSSPLAIKNMIFNAAKCVEHDINSKIVASLNS